jgi:hypothetical protein
MLDEEYFFEELEYLLLDELFTEDFLVEEELLTLLHW